jgi:hypothetical protein
MITPLQVVSAESKKRFTVGTQSEAVEFMVWLLNRLHVGLGGSRKGHKSIIHQCFQGEQASHFIAHFFSRYPFKIALRFLIALYSFVHFLIALYIFVCLGLVEVTSMTRHKIVISTSATTAHTSTHDDMEGSDQEYGDGEDDEYGKHTVHDDGDGGVRMEERWSTDTSSTPFMFLSLDIPPTPLFKVC